MLLVGSDGVKGIVHPYDVPNSEHDFISSEHKRYFKEQFRAVQFVHTMKVYGVQKKKNIFVFHRRKSYRFNDDLNCGEG